MINLSYIQSLIDLSLQTLPRMMVPGKNAFCCDLKRDDLTPVFDPDKSYRYTVMSLLGSAKARAAGYSVSLNLEEIYLTVLSHTSELKIGDLGLLLWLDHRLKAGRFAEIVQQIQARMPQTNLDDLETMQIAWLITGHAVHAANQGKEVDFGGKIREYFLSNRSAPSGLIYHYGKGFRRRFPNFATQIYSIHALSTQTRLASDPVCRDRAVRIAEVLKRLQRKNGGWPWLYDAERGVVIEPYEVYSVHQDAMAPMGLFELQTATGYNTADMILRGLEWLTGKNELHTDMVDSNTGLIYRSIRRNFIFRPMLKLRTLAGLLGITLPENSAEWGLEMNWTCRPYHLGWLLEAWCGQDISHLRLAS